MKYIRIPLKISFAHKYEGMYTKVQYFHINYHGVIYSPSAH